MTPEDYDRLLDEQGGGCACCGTQTPGGHGAFHIDHCHHTGRIRALLCHACNVALGGLKDSPERVGELLNYIEYHAALDECVVPA